MYLSLGHVQYVKIKMFRCKFILEERKGENSERDREIGKEELAVERRNKRDGGKNTDCKHTN